MKQGDFLLAKTYESITVPRNMIARVEGRSTYARVGLSMHQTAPWIQPGWKGQIILELLNNGPLTIKLTPKRDRPCQITFFKLTQEVDEDLAYGAKKWDAYQNQVHPIAPKHNGERLNRF
jgi:dCTP deaminase